MNEASGPTNTLQSDSATGRVRGPISHLPQEPRLARRVLRTRGTLRASHGSCSLVFPASQPPLRALPLSLSRYHGLPHDSTERQKSSNAEPTHITQCCIPTLV